ncbi:MAG: PAS domain S-box protein [Thermoanaerobaculia bacterium]|nr:PAS domain S-box protein [Thermoanaerobaculia bacterium]
MAVRQDSFELGTARVCGAIAAGFGCLALFGWALELPFLATFGEGRIPMAPSTAVLFVLYGAAVLLSARRPLGRGARGLGGGLVAAGALVAAGLLVLSFLGILPAAELLGFAERGALGKAPIGHMSPVVASCFLLASLSYLGSLASAASPRPGGPGAWTGRAARWTAGLVLATSLLLVLAYLFGSPLLYGGSFIPPAATTSLALTALGMALVALAGRAVRPPASTTAVPRQGVPRALVVIVVVLAAGIIALGGRFFRAEAERDRAVVEQQLAVAVELKASELAQWRAERLGDASILLGNPVFFAQFRSLLDDAQAGGATEPLRTWLTKVQSSYFYDQVSLLDSQGRERLVVPAGRHAVAAVIARRAPEILRTTGVTFEDFYRDERDGRIYLSLLVPIRDVQGLALGIVVLTIDPEQYLFPLLQRWPTPSRSAATLLIRQGGIEGLFPDELAAGATPASRQRLPLANPDAIDVEAVLGEEGIVEGRDDRGVQVLAAVRPIPDSPWTLVARIDAEEANEPLREQLREMIVLVLALLAAAVAGLGVVWREIRVRELRGRFEADRESAWLHDVVARSLNEVYVFDPETLKFRFVNRGACENLGYTPEELAGLTPVDLEPEFTIGTFRALLAPLRAPERPKITFEGTHRRKDGSDYPVEVHLQLVDSGATGAFLAVIDDITVRRRAERHIQQLNRVYALLSEVNQAIVRVRAPQELFAEACRIAVETGGFRMAWIGLVDATAKRLRPVAHAGVTDGYLERLQIPLGGGDDPRALGPTASALREGVHSVCNDIEHDPLMAPWRDDALKLGYRASAAFPLIVSGKPLGAFSLYAGEPGFFDAKELQLLDELATDLAFAMEMRQLEETRHRLATAIEQSPVAVTITDAEGRIEYVNPAFTEITGYTSEEALGGNPRMLKSGRQEPALYQELWATIRAGRSWRGELVNRRKDGNLYTQELTIAPVRGAAERVTHFIAISQDVSRRKQVEQELQSAEARYRGLFEQSPDGVLLIDTETLQTLEANEAAHSQLGYSLEEFAALEISDYEAQETPEETRRHIEKVLAEGSDDFETLHRTKDGEIRNVHVWTRRVQLGERNALHSIFEDVTERKRDEAALRLSEKRYRALFDRSLAGVYRTTLDGRILECNEAFARIFGFASRAEALLGTASTLYPTPADRADFLSRLRSTGVMVNREFEGRRQDGGTVWLLENAHLFDGGDSLTSEVIEGTLLDITERKNLEMELRQSQKIEAIGRLAGGVAHDFNNITGVILGYGELVRSEVEPGTPVAEYVTEMVQAAERAATLTRQLQAFSRKQILQPRRLDLNELVANAHRMLDRVIGEDIALVVRPAPTLGTVLADPGQIDQILLNLAINARDAMPKGGTLTIETADIELAEETPAPDRPAMVPGRYVRLAVSDTGVGMDAETQRRIFEPFFTTKPPGQGTGLGLATVYGIVKQSGGYIWVDSEPGLGTTFQIYLPRIDEPPHGNRPGVPPAMPPAMSHGGHETVLLVEDNPALRDVTRRQLEAAGYTVLLAGDGEEALALAGTHAAPIDLLLTDVVMPKLGGGELAGRLVALRPGLPVLFMSGYTDGAIAQHGMLADGIALLEKPFSGKGLVQAVRKALDRTTASGTSS